MSRVLWAEVVVAWPVQFGTSGDDYLHGVALGTSGEVYAVGNTDGVLAGTASAGKKDFVARAVYSTRGGLGTQGVKTWRPRSRPYRLRNVQLNSHLSDFFSGSRYR